VRAKTRGSRREHGVEDDLAARRNGLGQRHAPHRPVVRVVVVGVLERGAGREVLSVGAAERLDVDPAPAVLRHAVAAELAARLTEERALRVLEGVQVEMEPELADRLRGGVAPDDPLQAVECLRLGVEAHLHVVVGDVDGLLGQGVGRGDAARRVRRGLGRDSRLATRA
jgi:hypothetical protein